MKNTLIKYIYDGSDFFGSQRQPNKRTVQGEIERVLNKLLKEEIKITTAGRTDRGVHALEQVSTFISNLVIPYDNLLRALKNALPEDIKVLEVMEVDDTFHARFSAKEREYKYIITCEKSPFTYRYMTYIKEKIDIEKLQEIMNIFIGKHNFKNFMLKDIVEKNTNREIYFIKIEKNSNNLEIKIRGNSFVKSQIRLMVGESLDVYFGRKSLKYLKEMLDNPDRQYSKSLAEPNGLYLSKIIY
ncbi:MAG: tRNA pseudouridine(38-40) synthase TruA [Fusobacteriaceae bacterium]|jgi:tRNA pseudouridine38-40 synthase|nr:tRNA pseudouridine(38-40) synthase TruA [Fusobacteriaceae bacterium]